MSAVCLSSSCASTAIRSAAGYTVFFPVAVDNIADSQLIHDCHTLSEHSGSYCNLLLFFTFNCFSVFLSRICLLQSE